MPSYDVRELESRVEAAMRRVRAVLDRNRNPQLPSEVSHRYEDKYLLAEVLTRVGAASMVQSLEVLGLDAEPLAKLRDWARTRTVTLRFVAREDCAYLREESRKVESTQEFVSKVTGLFERKVERTDKVVTTVVEHLWGFDFEYELQAYPGTATDEAIELCARHGKLTLKTAAKTTPRPTSVVRPFVEVDATWLVAQLDDAGRSAFAIDRTAARCHTPRRNADVEAALEAMAKLEAFCGQVRRYFLSELFPVQQDHGRDLAAIEDASVFVPVLPLFEERSGEDGVLPAAYAHAFLAEERRSLDEKCKALAAAFPRDSSAITAFEATMLVTLAHMQSVARAYESGVDYVEALLRAQLVEAIGHEVTPADFAAYVDFHCKKLFSPAFRPVPFSYAVRRPEHDPEGVLALEVDHGGTQGAECIATSVARSDAARPMTFALDASTRVTFHGERHLHAWVTHQFSGQQGASLELVARARQFSSFLLLVGRIGPGDVFEPTCGVIVQNKDLVRIPLRMDAIPSAKEFRDAIESLSPEQQRFARAFRGMQLESTLFAVCVIQIKPQLEKLLRLPPDSLTKEIRLTQDILALFVEHQIPSDLLSYDGPSEATLESKIERVRGYVAKMQEMLDHSKQRELEQEREREAMRRARMNRTVDAQTSAGPMSPPSFGPTFAHEPIHPTPGSSILYSMTAAGAPRLAVPAAPPFAFAEAPGGSGEGSFAASELPLEATAPSGSSMAGDTSRPTEASRAQGSHEEASTSGGVDFAQIPAALDRKLEQLDDEGAVRATILKPGPVWSRTRQRGLLDPQATTPLGESAQKDERSKAFDLLDALTKSGALSIDEASLHVVVAATHCFDRTLLSTVIEANVNPIEKIERSLVIVGTTIHGKPASELLAPAQHERFFAGSPRLGPAGEA
jgi:hypothetical protein